jgi:hypothetical protein
MGREIESRQDIGWWLMEKTYIRGFHADAGVRLQRPFFILPLGAKYDPRDNHVTPRGKLCPLGLTFTWGGGTVVRMACFGE